MTLAEPLPPLTVVLPTLNEAATIGDIVTGVSRYATEVLVVDGHSTDATRGLAEQAGARVILDDGRGKGAGLRLALAAATESIVVFMDADGSHEIDDIPKLVAPLVRDEADMVVGCRMTGGSDELHGELGKFIRLIGSEILTLMINYRWNVRLTDVQNGFRAVRRVVGLSLNLKEDRFAVEEEMVMQCLRYHFRVVNVSSHEYKRAVGDSRIDLTRDWFSFIWCVLKHLVV